MSDIVRCEEEKVLLDNFNIAGVFNGPSLPTTFTIHHAHDVTVISTYHWNNGQGVPGGTIGLQCDDGSMHGPWPVTTGLGQGGVPNAFWNAHPDAHLHAGTYTVIDSSPSTWSTNGGTGGKGMTSIKGHEHAQHCCCHHCHHG